MTTAAPPLTARALRTATRAAQARRGHLDLLQDVAAQLAAHARPAAALTAALGAVLAHLGLDDGLLLQAQPGAFTVIAAQGAVLPVGARVPAGGGLSEALRTPDAPLLRGLGVSRLLLDAAGGASFELLVPMVLYARPAGLLAVIGTRGAMRPDAEDLAALFAVGVLMAGAVAPHAAPRPRRARPDAGVARLSPREQQVLSLLPRGVSNKELAAQLGIAPGTVKLHVERIIHKLGVRDRTAAAVIAVEQGLRA